MLQVHLNRYDGASIALCLKPETFSIRDGRAVAEIEWGEDHEIEVSFPASASGYERETFDLARQVLCTLGAFDNIVQAVCAEECKRSGLHSDNYESVLAGVSLNQDTITLHYWGAAVNTEWDEKFTLVGDGWVHTQSGTGAGSGAMVRLGDP